jgi:hypothetical protein
MGKVGKRVSLSCRIHCANVNQLIQLEIVWVGQMSVRRPYLQPICRIDPGSGASGSDRVHTWV